MYNGKEMGEPFATISPSAKMIDIYVSKINFCVLF